MSEPRVTIRSCHTVEEFEEMVDLEVKVWGFGERDTVPSQMYVVASKIGGQVMAAYVEGKIAGFVLGYPGIRDGKPYLHSHMAGVLPEFRNLGIGRRLKLAQRDDALERGIPLIEWTFDPLQARNAYFNICRLGVVVRRYLLNVYGATSSPLHAGLPTDRLVAEWHLDSSRVKSVLGGNKSEVGETAERISFAVDESSPESMQAAQEQLRRRFLELFDSDYEVTWFEPQRDGGTYILEPGVRGT